MKLRFIFLITVLLFSCKKNKNLHPVPNQSFDFTIDLSLPSYADLNGVGGYSYVNGGSKGIIVYRRSIDEFIAFDRHSPADVEGTCSTALTPNSDNFLILDDACNNAQFSLYDGSVISNCEFGLRQYTTMWDGSQSLRIFN